MEEKRCSKCKKTLPVTDFWKDNNRKCGRVSACRACRGARFRGRGTKPKPDKDTMARRIIRRRWYMTVGNSTKKWGTSKRESFEYSIDEDYLYDLYLSQSGVCAITGLEMTLDHRKKSGTNLSIDRIDSNVGYVPGNVRLVCSRANLIRNDMTDDETLHWCRLISEGLGA